MARRRSSRIEAIREIVRSGKIRTQRELATELRNRGFECTQATVSRDVMDIGLRKQPDGSYALQEDQHLRRMISEFVTAVSRANNLVVINTQPGTASGVAAAIDAAGLDQMLGSVAGNDTVLVISSDDRQARELCQLFDGLRATGTAGI